MALQEMFDLLQKELVAAVKREDTVLPNMVSDIVGRYERANNLSCDAEELLERFDLYLKDIAKHYNLRSAEL